MATRTASRFFGALLVGALFVAGASGCGKDGTGTPPAAAPDETSEGLGSTGSSGSSGSSGTEGGTGNQGGGTGQPPPAQGYPATAREYAEATLAALAAKQSTRLADLTTPEVHEQLVELPGGLKTDWLYIRCDGVAGGNYCTLRNGDGDALTLKVLNQRLGSPDAVTEVKADLTTYPAAGEAYAREFVVAWAQRNIPRMRVLGTPDVVTKLNTDHPAPAGYKVSLTSKSGGAGLLLVTVPDGAGGTYILHVGTTKLGGRHAVVGYEP